ncbi:MAG: alpha/beta hydrolase [Lewinellaceae bacterium]|nr:alpha/beta hydrolase [Lewinellaceae bacterium]
MAQEIAKIHAVEKIILLSSIKSGKENARVFRMINRLGLYHFFNKEITMLTFPFWAKAHGYKTLEHLRLSVDMIKKTTNCYLQWALREVSRWENNRMPDDTAILPIHGEHDRTFPICRLEEPLVRVPDGSHFMVYDKPDFISELICRHAPGLICSSLMPGHSGP